MKKIKLVFIFTLLSIISKAPNICENNLSEMKKEALIDYKIEKLKKAEFSFKNYLEYLEVKNIKEKNILTRQSILETGWFKSEVFKNNNNLFGMKHPKIRETVSMGSELGHAKYKHWTDSIDDYLMWLDYHQSILDKSKSYYSFLKDVGYSTSKNYVKTLKEIET